MTTPAIDRARRFSELRLDRLRVAITGVVPAEVVVVACGSYARREASSASDFDYFSIAPSEPDVAPAWLSPLRRSIAGIVQGEAASDGAFGRIETRERMVRNIGGQGDDNQKLTRRMLFLLEGVPLTAPERFRAIRRAILDRYLRAAPTNEPLALFLLDDVIRYYRTMAVDYEYKTTEGDRPKPWGLRNVKLMFSRKLLYAGGLFSIAATIGSTPSPKAERLEALLDLVVMDRISVLCGTERTAPLLESYDRFLVFLEDTETRRRLEALSPDDQADPLFCAIRAEGQRFADLLLRLFHEAFGPDHPIHRAMVL